MLQQTRTTAKKSAKLEKDMQAFFARGGSITMLEPYDRGYNNTLRHCSCGCRGIIDKHCEKRAKKNGHKKDFPFANTKDM